MKSALARDRLLAIASWWFGRSGWIAALASLNPPMRPKAWRHCFAGFVFSAGLSLLNPLEHD